MRSPLRASWFWDSVLDKVLEPDQKEQVINSSLLYFRPLFVILLFAGLWGFCVLYFEQNRINYRLVLGIKRHETTRPSQLLRSVLFLSIIVFICLLWYLVMPQMGVHAPWSLLPVVACYATVAYFVFSKHVETLRGGRVFLRRVLFNCVFIPDHKVTPFIEVLVADGLTSLAKVFYDFGVVLCFMPAFTVGAFSTPDLVAFDQVADVCVHNRYQYISRINT
jgi:hypothetical protein